MIEASVILTGLTCLLVGFIAGVFVGRTEEKNYVS